MRGEYAARLQSLRKTLREAGQVQIVPDEFRAGPQLCTALNPKFRDVEAAALLDARGITTLPFSTLAYGEEWPGVWCLLHEGHGFQAGAVSS
jgi:hypothetical protein